MFVSSDNRVAAERMEFNTRTRTGTFFIASGVASLAGEQRIDRSLFGTQEPDAYFWGETIEKLGPKTYRITNGGFTTCVQPTPRWELVSGSVTLTLEEHAFLKNSILKVKGVPLFYLPVMYYPINKEDRSTGFLIPTYGSSTIRGQTLSNAFFWAINRSQDATFYYDYYSKTGQGFGSEYRYVEAPGSAGTAHFQAIDEHDSTYDQPDGSETVAFGQLQLLVQREHGAAAARPSAGDRQRRLLFQRHGAAALPAEHLSVDQQHAPLQRESRGQLGALLAQHLVDRTQTFSGENIWSLYGSAPR